MERIIKPAFAVIGMEGATTDGPGFIPALWERANSRFGEVAGLAKTNPDGSLCGVWGAMTDMSRSFLPWEEGFTKGLVPRWRGSPRRRAAARGLDALGHPRV